MSNLFVTGMLRYHVHEEYVGCGDFEQVRTLQRFFAEKDWTLQQLHDNPSLLERGEWVDIPEYSLKRS